ncbi:alkyl/aryl-sulfatase [Mycobacteroides chelonae]|jgi:alkyl sulfatase BDS1-like metallo-beta-lactamase superfamily hydrolase|uniref:Linear primary-alkylsulfatase n=1 Tax=Mycobacteroides chelonae TaxID=1774 RepID=A0AB73MI99_MYCCH|nr:alkyl sulfatase dimerization domain-containing protein [Mycobacteroides chelonae]MBF9328186.1 MBL fold metallo-hydrolase [Mycobacteroides chelonae]MBF9422364.1 MBL fold metallo-hydrolase [Mycobacteroides chelonae]MBF9435488.1 MBL fold metallo-hydrolase [Mycobacteroides chelonae]MBV6362238.1 MBL fold metallo-hydrolase [Mycobacteroides chelonae]MEC4837089.1 alkyl sulfatase dimerization domain-containing protein [Mycobacteroides chelonae]
MEQTQPTSRIIEQNVAAAQELPFANTADQDDADRGFIAALEPGIVTDASGKTVWDNDSYGFLRDSCPASVHPSLWRQCGLNIRQGLYLVTEGIYQVRGLDISNMTLVEGERGVIVIDPLVSAETAAAALALYRSHRGDRPVTGLIYTHSHADHFGGALGVVSAEDVASGHCPVLAPAGFLEHAVAENVYAGTAMTRRAVYMYGAVLPRGPLGQVGSGLGQTNSIGTVTLIPPTLDITHTGQEETIDGVRMVFQLTPGTEAPAEMNFHFPQRRALCMAENATHTLHNLLTLRGALVRDPHVWARYITEAINLYARASDVVFASHHWPTWGTELLVEYLALQRDLYAYLHDQTLRQLNQGLVGSEIAESLQLPPALANAWHARGYYGSVSHNVKAIYQRYMGWFDGNPAHLWEHPPVANAQRHVEFMGGAEEVLRKARIAFEEGDYRWVAQVVNYVIFADPANEAAKALQASCFRQLGYGSENATWRNFYLMGAYELSHGNVGTPITVGSPSVVAALTVDQVFDALSLRINGPKAWDEHFVSDWRFIDEDRVHRVELRNGVLVHYDRPADISEPDVTFTLTRPILIKVLLDGTDPAQLVASGEITVDGDVTGFARLVAVLDQPDPNFAIVTP